MASLRVEVVYALPRAADLSVLALARGARVRDALAAAGLVARHAALRGAAPSVGINGVPAGLDTPLADGDRVEVYRPLRAEPRADRRARAARRARR